ncbi:MAG: acyl-CoA dehydratase activase [Syntrophorhabdaceae bacterium]
MKSGGIDIGSRYIKYVVLEDGKPSFLCTEETGYDPLAACNELLKKTRPDSLLATGYGRHLLESEIGVSTITEIKAVARGARHIFPSCRTVIDIGGQDTKVVELDRTGFITSFEMNDRCAAGTGKFLEIMAHALGYTIETFDRHCGDDQQITINSLCAVFAESEVISLITRGVKREAIATALHYSVINRIIPLIRRIGVKEDVVFAGGCTRNAFLTRVLQERLQMQLQINEYSTMLSAIGAALYAADQ